MSETTQVGSLDMASHLDRGLVRRQATDPANRRPRWGVDDAFKDDAIRALRVAMRMALEKKDHRAAASCVSTLAVLESQNQSDDHLAARLAVSNGSGLGHTTIVVNILGLNDPVPPPPQVEIVSTQ